MQQATYRSRRNPVAGQAPYSPRTLNTIGIVAGEIAALASMVVALAASLLVAASYLL